MTWKHALFLLGLVVSFFAMSYELVYVSWYVGIWTGIAYRSALSEDEKQ